VGERRPLGRDGVKSHDADAPNRAQAEHPRDGRAVECAPFADDESEEDRQPCEARPRAARDGERRAVEDTRIEHECQARRRRDETPADADETDEEQGRR